MTTCEWEWYGFPHPGAAEFGPPDRFSCQEPAVVAFLEEDGWPGPDPGSEIRLCRQHANDEFRNNLECPAPGFILKVSTIRSTT